MENKVLPAVRVPTVPAGEGAEDGGAGETPIVDLPPSEKFGFAWPDQSKSAISPIMPTGAGATDPESDFETSEAESQGSKDSFPAGGDNNSADHTPTNESPTSNMTPTSPPRLSRAFSMPLTSQLGHLKNPHRSADHTPAISPLALSQPPSSLRFREISLELADSVQMVVQTLLQISPPHLLDRAKEQFSACSLSVPSPSVTAMLTAMKNLNYMSANMSTFADDSRMFTSLHTTGHDPSVPPTQTLEDFDIGETLQSVGDVLSGLAAQAGVELVLFHGDVGMKHVSVRGDECGLSYALSHIIRQVLDTSQRGDTLEIGLYITTASKPKDQDAQESDEESRSSSRMSFSSPEFNGLLRCTFDVGHKFSTPDSAFTMENNPKVTASTSLFRSKPRMDTIFLRRMLARIGGTLKEDLQPHSFSPGRSCELTVTLEAGSSEYLTQPPRLSAEEEAMRQPYASMNIQLASEPSLEELSRFIESLKGKKVALHASAKGSFAHHLTSYLTAWGLDVSHMSVPTSDAWSSPDNGSDVQSVASKEDYRTSPTTTITDSPIPVEVNPMEEQFREKAVGTNPTFVLIDDDETALRQRLIQLRSEAPFNLSLRQRPKLASHHRPKSSPQIFRTKGVKSSLSSPSQPPQHPVIIHFTCLSNYKIVKDLIHAILSTPSSSSLIPEIIVLPKPAGPRRLLTALRTAIVKPIVDPFFTPIATSPMSPNGQGINPFFPFSGNSSPSQRGYRPSISPRTASSRSSKDVAELVPRLPPSPLRESDSLEYFSEAAVKLGTSPSSGLVIQSPDGQPAGIFFHPRGAVNPPNLVRNVGNLKPPGEHRRLNLSRHVTDSMESDAADRSKPLNRPATLARNRSGLTHINEDLSEHIESSSSLTSMARRIRTSTTPREDMVNPQITNTVPTPPTSLPPQTALPIDDADHTLKPEFAADARKPINSPTSPNSNRVVLSATPGGVKRSYTRRGTQDSASSAASSTTKKGKPSADGNILPPVNVLIVEDNPINQTILSTFMRKRKIKYDVAKNGLEAVAKWKAGGFHLILMDIQMPIMDGIEATKEIRSLERQAVPFPSTPPIDGQQTPSDAPSTESRSSASNQTPFRSSVIIVALTASSLQSDRVAALAAGCNDFLTKPVSLLWLNNKIIEWGSIKALQMWADLRPEVMKSISHGQVNQAKSVASRLHVPESRRASRSLSPSESKPASSGTSQIDAMRMLSKGVVLSRNSDQNEFDLSGLEAPVTLDTADNAKLLPIQSIVTESETSSGISSTPAETPLDDKGRSKSPLRLAVSREVSEEEALRTHLQDSATEASSLAERNALDRLVVLGERAINSGSISIAEVMHGDAGPDAGINFPAREGLVGPKLEEGSPMIPPGEQDNDNPVEGPPPQDK
ncbi:hypothetical protein EW145_g776 [Phellinidium pouzarii]|uniref:Response regulatory domain-containing protein n=1 Tax=Phellinidium pouzarii TaxID=167371 RepID=A0A4S4LIX7_9AGAM|nr:hypothetical protein EW145_g776 [Phellinidium pouzarii]